MNRPQIAYSLHQLVCQLVNQIVHGVLNVAGVFRYWLFGEDQRDENRQNDHNHKGAAHQLLIEGDTTANVKG